MDRFDQAIQKKLAVLVASGLALGIFAANEVKAQQASASSTRQDGVASAGGESGEQNSGQDPHSGSFATLAAPGPKVSLLNRLRPSLVESTTMCVQLFYVCHGRKHLSAAVDRWHSSFTPHVQD